jgi:hypothetical protein
VFFAVNSDNNSRGERWFQFAAGLSTFANKEF